MDSILSRFDSISLDEMSGIRLMNRTDTKFVTSAQMLRKMLEMASKEYLVQEIGGRRNMLYYTVYFDTPDYTFYNTHHNGHCNRQKVRLRSYVESHLSFLEVKTKDNHGRTRKKRVGVDAPASGLRTMSLDCGEDFLAAQLRVDPHSLSQKIENRFNRITLVNKARTERLTIDTQLEFNNLDTGRRLSLGKTAIIELKRDGLQPSPILAILHALHIKPCGFSKYCIGEALTNPDLKHNRLKPRIRKIKKTTGETLTLQQPGQTILI